jgi:hypothetical protein
VGLHDILMKNGPRGRPSRTGSDGGMWRIMIAILGLLAYNMFKGSGGQAAPLLRATPQPRPATAPLALDGNGRRSQRYRGSADFNEPEAGRLGAPIAPFVPSASSGRRLRGGQAGEYSECCR